MAGAPPHTPLRELTALPRPLAGFKGPISKGKEGKGWRMGEREGKGGKDRGRQGGEGRERREEKGRGAIEMMDGPKLG